MRSTVCGRGPRWCPRHGLVAVLVLALTYRASGTLSRPPDGYMRRSSWPFWCSVLPVEEEITLCGAVRRFKTFSSVCLVCTRTGLLSPLYEALTASSL